MPLTRIKLYAKEEDYGWLTAYYNNDRSKPEQIDFSKAESDIDYSYLGDSKKNLPEKFRPQGGMITWEGSIASDLNGEHKLRITYAGYIKIWIEGKLLVDKWRMAWNPGSSVVKLTLETNKKYAIKIQWIPDGGESYLSVKWLHPTPQNDANAYCFASEAG